MHPHGSFDFIKDSSLSSVDQSEKLMFSIIGR